MTAVQFLISTVKFDFIVHKIILEQKLSFTFVVELVKKIKIKSFTNEKLQIFVFVLFRMSPNMYHKINIYFNLSCTD